MEHIEQAGVHSGDSACSLPPYSLSAEMQDEMRRQTVAMARGLNVVGLMNVQFAIQNGTVYVLEVNPRASRTVPFVSKATGVPLAKIAARCMVGRIAGRAGHHRGDRAAVLLGQGGGVPVHQVPRRRHHPRAGDEVHRRGDGRGRDLRRGVPQVAARRRREAADGGRGVHQRAQQRQGAGGRDRAHAGRDRLHAGRHPRHRGRARRRGSAGDAGEQGGRRPAAHRRHDQERRDRAGRQHGRGEALGDPGQLRDPPRGADRPGADLHDAGRRPGGGERHARDAASWSRTRCRRCTSGCTEARR